MKVNKKNALIATFALVLSTLAILGLRQQFPAIENSNSDTESSHKVLGIFSDTGNRNDGPYDPSAYITGIRFDTDSVRREAPGSDNWPVTWCGDGNQYTAWGDGGGFEGGTNGTGRVSFGFARVEGDSDNYTGYNVWGGVDPDVDTSAIGAKSYGVLCIDGELYMWLQKNSVAADMYPRTWLTKSTDKGESWSSPAYYEDHGVEFYDYQDLMIPTFLQMDKGYEAGHGDGYVYAYFVDPTCWGAGQSSNCEEKPSNELTTHTPGKIYLARIATSELTKSDFTNQVTASDFEFYTSTNPGNPTWGSMTDKQPVFYDAKGTGWNLTASYNYGVGRYILMTEHENTSVGKLGIFEGDNPWGPWRTVAYYNDNWLGSSNNTFYWQISQKWSDPTTTGDGRKFTMVYTGINYNDAWQTVDGEFVLAGDPQTSSSSTSSQTTSQTSSATSTPPPTSGAISNLVVNDSANAADWAIESDLNIDRIIYGDRDYQITELPNELVGAQWISTANDSKNYTGSPLVSFNLNKSGTVYIGYDTRMNLPSWLSGWTATGETIYTTDTSLALYSKDFSVQNVSLGPNGESWGSMYSIAVVASDETSSSATSTTTSSTTSTSPIRTCLPDYNEDDIVDAADLSIFAQNYLVDDIDCSLDLASDNCRLDEVDFTVFDSAYKIANYCD